MLIPIGQENSTVRRTPWVAFVILGLNLLVAWPIDLSARSTEAAVRTSARQVFSFMVEHPYLELPTSLSPLLDPALVARFTEVRQAYLDADALPPQERLQEEQQRLAELSRALADARAATPWSRFGFSPGQPRVFNLLSHLFVHAGWLHLFGNLLMFFALGPFLEDVFGRPVFVALYLLSGAVAAGAHALGSAGSQAPLVGASGAIAGVMGAFLVRLGSSRIRFLFLPLLVLPFFRVELLFSGYLFLPLWFVGEHWAATHAVRDGVAYWAHVGGFVFGVAFAGVLRLSRLEERWINRAIEDEVSLVQHPAIEAANQARLAGDLPRARLEIRKALAAGPDNLDAWSEACDIAIAAEDPAELERAGSRLLDLYARAGEHELANGFLREVVQAESPLISAGLLLASASYCERTGDMPAALHLLDRVVEKAGAKDIAVVALFRAGEIYRKGGDPGRARMCYQRARAHAACQGHWPQRLDVAMNSLGG